MSDKDLLVVISEMLHKQDQHTEILQSHTEILSGHTEILKKQGETLETMSKTLTTLTTISAEQFGQQKKFNKQFLNRFDNIEKLLVHILDERIKRLEAAVFK